MKQVLSVSDISPLSCICLTRKYIAWFVFKYMPVLQTPRGERFKLTMPCH